ncbi:hypothetical protein ACJMK2_011512, partial [Sinanodonta woodiana]
DKNLPSVPPILVTLPEDYPESSPEYATSGKDYDSTPFLKAILRGLSTYLFEIPGQFSLTSLLDMWLNPHHSVHGFNAHTTQLPQLPWMRISVHIVYILNNAMKTQEYKNTS